MNMIKNLNWRKCALFAFVVAMASCALPPKSHAASVDLTWQDNTSTTTAATVTEVYEQTPTGVVLGTLPGRWTLIASPATTPDVDPVKPGKQQFFNVPNVPAGTHTYAVVATNVAGKSGPSNAAGVLMPDVPESHTLLTATVHVN